MPAETQPNKLFYCRYLDSEISAETSMHCNSIGAQNYQCKQNNQLCVAHGGLETSAQTPAKNIEQEKAKHKEATEFFRCLRSEESIAYPPAPLAQTPAKCTEPSAGQVLAWERFKHNVSKGYDKL